MWDHLQIASQVVSREITHTDTSADLNEQVEADLVRAACDDFNLFAPIYSRYAPRIYLYCLRRVGSPQDAEDLTSLTFTRALGALANYRGGSVAAWLFRMAHNAVVDYHRDRQVIGVPLDCVQDKLLDSKPPPVDQVIHGEQCAYLRDLIATFSDDEQELLALSISGGLTSEEIGLIMGKKPSAIRMRLHRLFKRLRALWSEEFV